MTEESRQIYVGDMIRLTVDSSYASEKEIMEAFSDLELVSIEDMGEAYEVTLRSFEPGTYELSLAGQEIQILVGSTLTDLQRETIFEPEALEAPGFSMPYMPILIVMSIVAIVSLLGLVVIHFYKRKEKVTTPYEVFESSGKELPLTPNGLGQLSLAFKRYLVDSGHIHPLSSSTEDLLIAINESDFDQSMIVGLTDSLRGCDQVHYRQDKPASEAIEALFNRIHHLASALHDLEKDVVV